MKNQLKSHVRYTIFPIALSLCGSATVQAAISTIEQMSINGGTLGIEQNGSTTTNLITFIGSNTNLVGGYIGNGGSNLADNVPDPDRIVGLELVGLPVNVYTAATNLGDTSTPAGTQAGGAVPTGTLDDIANTITMDLSSWFMNGFNNDIQAGTGRNDGFTSALATGTWDSNTNAYTLHWDALVLDGPSPEVAHWSLTGYATTITTVPLPAAIWLFGSGMLGLLGLSNAWRRFQ